MHKKAIAKVFTSAFSWVFIYFAKKLSKYGKIFLPKEQNLGKDAIFSVAVRYKHYIMLKNSAMVLVCFSGKIVLY